MLKLATREAMIGPSINTRTESHGDENVTALDIPLSFLLDPVELCAVLRSVEAAHRLFLPDPKGVLDQPALPALRSLALIDKIETCHVVLVFDALAGPVTLTLTDCTLAKVKLTPKFAGRTECHVTVQTTPDLEAPILELLGAMNRSCQVAIESETWNSQGNLALEQPK